MSRRDTLSPMEAVDGFQNPTATGSTTDHVILLTVRDITEVLQARKDSATANLKAEFLAVLAHDIRMPVCFSKPLPLAAESIIVRFALYRYHWSHEITSLESSSI